MLVRSASTSAPKPSRSAAARTAPKAPAKRSPTLPAGQDETVAEPDFGEEPAPAPAKAAKKSAGKAKAAAGPLTATFAYSHETKGAHVYNEVDDAGEVLAVNGPTTVVGNLYVRKTAITGEAPKRLTITITL